MKLLVVAPNWIGDAIMAQPLLRLLRARWPQAHITVLAPPHVAPVFECMDEVAQVLPEALAHGKLQWRARVAIARRLRGEGYARAYVLPNSLKSALIPWLARIPVRVGYTGEARALLLNRRLPNPDKHQRPPMTRWYAALAGADDAASAARAAALDASGADRPRLSVDLARATIVKAKYLGSATVTVGFCPGAEYGPAKRWPSTHFAQLAARIVSEHPGAQIVCLGGPKDRAIAQEIVAAAGVQVLNLCGETSLLDAIALMKSMTAVVTNDSGLMHMAAALDVPLVALYGSTDPAHTPPLSPLAAIARIPIECSPCFQRVCPLGHLRCLNDLTPDLIWAQLQPRLAKRGLIPS